MKLRNDGLVAHSDRVVHKYGQELLLWGGGGGVGGFETVDFFESWHVQTVTANAEETGFGNLLRSGLAYSSV